VVLGSKIPESKDKGTPEGKRDAIKQEHALDTFVGKLEHHFDTREGNGSMQVSTIVV
jgi:hypothetical protein